MTLTGRLRRLALALHLACSAGWIGAVGAYLVLDITVATSNDPAIVRAAWQAMALIVWWAILPLAVASLVTGTVMALGTKWGLFRHWWVVISFVLTLFATVVLVSEARVIGHAAAMAADANSAQELMAIPPTLVHSVGGLVVLLVVQVLNVLKPPGLTPYGWRRLRSKQLAPPSAVGNAPES